MYPIIPVKNEKGKTIAHSYKDVQFASKEEVFFSWWLDELKDVGAIAGYECQPESIRYAEPWVVKRINQGMERALKQKTILEPRGYTPDFNIEWNDMSETLFYPGNGIYYKQGHHFALSEGGGDKLLVEVKADYDAKDKTAQFKIKQSVIFDKLGIYINLVKIPGHFKKTFTPERYLMTDKLKQKRKLKYKPASINEFLGKEE